MNDIIYLLKFGKEKHLRAFANGKLYFGNAKLYRGIEEDLKIKGQGDKLEASTKVFSDNMKMYDNQRKRKYLQKTIPTLRLLLEMIKISHIRY